MTIQATDLATKIYNSGSYNPGATTYPGPVLKDTNGNIGNAGSKNTDFSIPAGHRVSFALTLISGIKYRVDFHPPTTYPTCKAVYLPFLPNNIASAVLPAAEPGVDHFFTDGLSGCAILVDRLPDGNLVVYHANASGLSPTALETTKDPSYEKPSAVAVMESYRRAARAHSYPGAVHVGSLFKSTYNRQAKALVDRQRMLRRPNPDFWGGTNVIGFRTTAGWEFWFQTYGAPTNTDPPQIVEYARFIP